MSKLIQTDAFAMIEKLLDEIIPQISPLCDKHKHPQIMSSTYPSERICPTTMPTMAKMTTATEKQILPVLLDPRAIWATLWPLDYKRKGHSSAFKLRRVIALGSTLGPTKQMRPQFRTSWMACRTEQKWRNHCVTQDCM